MTRHIMVPAALRGRKTQVGDRFGRLTVQSAAAPARWGAPRWLCACACGGTIETNDQTLRNGGTRSCGCLRREKLRAKRSERKNFVHGMSHSPEYRVWLGMKTRCYNSNDTNFWHYGRLGVKVCARWRTSFVAFYEDMGPRPSPRHSLDRIDPHGNYEPGNCRWATYAVQARNKRRKLPEPADVAARVRADPAKVRLVRSSWSMFMDERSRSRRRKQRGSEDK